MTRSLRYFRPEVPPTGVVYRSRSDRTALQQSTRLSSMSRPRSRGRGRAGERAVVLRTLRLGAARSGG
jgi:hypothetical protein